MQSEIYTGWGGDYSSQTFTRCSIDYHFISFIFYFFPGYRCSKFHHEPHAIKTDAPDHVVSLCCPPVCHHNQPTFALFQFDRALLYIKKNLYHDFFFYFFSPFFLFFSPFFFFFLF